jgi:hypothetical protein
MAAPGGGGTRIQALGILVSDLDDPAIKIGRDEGFGRTRVLPAVTDGIVSRTLAVALRRNALVERFDVVVRAQQADATILANCAQVRTQEEGNGIVTAIADFGSPRTVSGVGAVADASRDIGIFVVTPWTGVEFGTKAAYTATIASDAHTHETIINAHDPSTPDEAIFPDVRTERLRISLVTAADSATIASRLWARLPDLPADLELRIDGGPPVWTSPGSVQPGARGFDAEGRQTVALGPALAALTGDPTRDEAVTFQVVLASRIPGKLDLTTGTISVRHLARVDLGAEGERQLTFDAEGLQELTLPLASWVNTVERVSMTLTAKLPAERVIPPVGPPAAPIPGGGGATLAELVLDPDHAATARLPMDTDLVEIVAIRLPLRAAEGGAEARVVLLEAGTEPGAVVDGGTTKPVIFEDTAEAWTTFTLPRPVKLDPTAPPWAALMVSRGSVSWTLGAFATASVTNAIRRGPPTGPWRTLPSLLSSVPTIGGRLRVVGHASDDRPVAPFVVNVQGTDPAAVRLVPATPTAKGTRFEWRLSSNPATVLPVTPRVTGGARSVVLQVISRVVGTVTIRDVDVVATRTGGA